MAGSCARTCMHGMLSAEYALLAELQCNEHACNVMARGVVEYIDAKTRSLDLRQGPPTPKCSCEQSVTA
jgi:hypothetical protein